MSKVLFVYPNKEGYPVIPMAVSLLSAILEKEGHQTDVFDITFMVPEKLDHKAREKIGFVKHVDVEEYWGKGGTVNINEQLREKMKSFDPDLVAFTIVENNYGCARDFFKIVKGVKNVPIIVGGIFPTIVPKFFIEDENVDLICIGEGEKSIIEVVEKIERGQDLSGTPNIIVKSSNGISTGRLAEYYRWFPPIFQNWDIFDPRHLFKPFIGKMYKTGYFEMARGCLLKCTFCNNQTLREEFKDLGKFNRNRPIGSLIDEIMFLKEKHQLELIFFNDDNFLQINRARLEEFCEEYTKKIRLPFFMQTTAQTLQNEDVVKMIGDAGCVTIGIGVEHGNEEIRKKILDKHVPDHVIEKAFKNCKKFGIRTTAFIIIGLPFETEENIIETAMFCRKIEVPSVTLSILAPYYGTPLRKLCVENGFMEDRYYEEIGVNFHSILTMPQLSKEKLEELYYKMHDLIYGNMPPQ